MPKAASDVVRRGHTVCAGVPNLHPSSALQHLRRVLYKKSFFPSIGTRFLWFVLWCLFLSFPAEGTEASSDAISWKRASSRSEPASPQAGPCWIRSPGGACQALCSCRARRQRRGLCLRCRMPDSAAKSLSCLRALLEKPSAGILLGWEHPVPDVPASLPRLPRDVWLPGDGAAPEGFTSSVPGSSRLEGMNETRGFVFLFPSFLALKV